MSIDRLIAVAAIATMAGCTGTSSGSSSLSAPGGSTGSTGSATTPTPAPESPAPRSVCEWTATVAAGQDVEVVAQVDDQPSRTYGVANAMTLDTAELEERCDQGLGFDTDDYVCSTDGEEAGDACGPFGLGVVPAVVPAAFLEAGRPVYLLFAEPKGAVAILVPDATSAVTSVVLDYYTDGQVPQ